MARGLAAAHACGLVHAHLGPGAVVLAPGDHVKVLGFLPLAGDAAEPDGTGPSGTEAPEQLRGEEPDARTDLFALGVCLHEMLAGRSPFARPTAREVREAILSEDPEGRDPLPRSTPRGLADVAKRCLEKRREARFQSAADLAFALEQAVAGAGNGEGARRRSGAALGLGGASRGMVAAAAAAGLLAGAGLVSVLRRPVPPQPRALRALTHSGLDTAPAVSPDGELVAFVSRRDDRFRIWLEQRRVSAEVALTEGPRDSDPRFFPDGASVLFTRRDEALRPSLHQAPVLGGPPRLVARNAFDGDVSPDGRTVAFLRAGPNPNADFILCLAPAEGGPERELARFAAIVSRPRFSPDGRLVALSEPGSAQSGVPGAVTLVGLDGSVRRLPSPRPTRGMTSVAWLGPGRELLAGFLDTGIIHAQGTGAQLFRMPRDGGAPVALDWWPDVGTTLDVLASGRAVYESVTLREGLHEVPLGGGPSRWLTRGTATDRQPVVSPDGETVLFASDRSGNLDLWRLSRRTGAVRRLTDDPAEDWDPAFSADGRSILWSSNRRGRFEIWTARADGSEAQPLTPGGVAAENPVACPDGERIAFGNFLEGTAGLWVVRRDGSGARRIADGVTRQVPEVSPDGRYLLHRHGIGPGRRALEVLTLDGGVKVFEVPLDVPDWVSGAEVGRARWMPSGREIAFIGLDARGVTGVYLQAFAPGLDTSATRRPVAGFDPERPVESFGVAPDGKALILAERENRSSLVEVSPLAGVEPPRSPSR